MYEEVFGKALFASVAVWFLVVTSEVVRIDLQTERVVSLPETSTSVVS